MVFERRFQVTASHDSSAFCGSSKLEVVPCGFTHCPGILVPFLEDALHESAGVSSAHASPASAQWLRAGAPEILSESDPGYATGSDDDPPHGEPKP